MLLGLARTLPNISREEGGFHALVGYPDRVPIPRAEISGSWLEQLRDRLSDPHWSVC